MTTGTAIDASVGFALETTVGTLATPTRWVEFDTESLKHESGWGEPTGLRVGRKFKRASRLTRTSVTANGSLELHWATRNMGTLVKAMLGSTVTTPTLVTGTAYKQVHQYGDFLGKALTVQVGRPEPSGTIRPFTYKGCKVVGWEIAVSDGEIATLSLDLDGWDEDTTTALTAPSFVSAEELGSLNASLFKLGGTATTGSGIVSIASGVQVASVVKNFSIKGTTPMATERRGLGNSGIKKEQLENDIPTVTVSMEAEFSKTELYDLYKNNTTTALQLSLIGSQIAATGSFNTLDIIVPALKLKGAPPAVGGPDIVMMSVDAEVYDDETNAPLQITIISADSTAL